MFPQRFTKKSERFELKLAYWSACKSEILIPVLSPKVGVSAKHPDTVPTSAVWLFVVFEIIFDDVELDDVTLVEFVVVELSVVVFDVELVELLVVFKLVLLAVVLVVVVF